MTQDLVSTAPSVYAALLGLVQTAAQGQNPPVSVFAFELGQYQPATYVTVHAIENHQWEPETIGSFTQREGYDICGCVSVYSGDSPFTNPTLAATVLNQTYALFQTLVMTPAMSNRTIPILGASDDVFQMLPGFSRYTAGPGNVGGNESGWSGVLEFSFHFDALVTPQ